MLTNQPHLPLDPIRLFGWTPPRSRAPRPPVVVPELISIGKMAKFRGYRRVAGMLFRAAHLVDPQSVAVAREIAKLRPRKPDEVAHLGSVGIGTTGLCNASCIHCPTGKPETALSPRRPMTMELFRKIVDGIADEGLEVRHMIGFGLFGDGLVDPFVVERARYLRQRLPDVLLSVNTNGAAFNPQRHAALKDHATIIALHCESLIPETFDRLMTPLRLKNVLPKYEAILTTFPKVRVSIPVSRANIGEIEAMRSWFLARGAHEVVFDPLSSRCAPDRTLFDSLALAPQRIRCGKQVTDDLIVDCDGVVLACCQDFTRSAPLGDLSRETFRATMTNFERRRFAWKMGSNRHDEFSGCSRCYSDIRTPRFPFDQVAANP